MAGDEGGGGILHLLRALEPDQLHEGEAGFSLAVSHLDAVDTLQGDELRLAASQGAEIRQQGRAYLLQGVDRNCPKAKVGHGKPLGCDK